MDTVYDSISADVGEALASAGQSKVPMVTCTIEDVLTPDDVAAYCQQYGDLPAQKSDEKSIVAIRARHHQVARYLALGFPESLVAELTGYQAAHISTLKHSPAMQELIAHFRAPGDNATKLIAEKLRLMADMSLEQIIEKISNGEADVNQLLAAIKLGADRSNNGPMQKVDVSHTHSLDEEQVRRLSETSRKVNRERIIDISAVRQSLPSPRTEDETDAS